MATRFKQTLRTLAMAVGVVVALLCAGAAQAAAPFEPNDNLGQAYGPLVGDLDTAGAFETSNDNDYFYFYTSGQVQFQVEVKLLSDDCSFFADVLRGDDGKGIVGDVLDPWGDAIKTYTYTSPGPRKYYLALTHGSCGEQYSFKLSPASAFTTNAPAPALSAACVIAKGGVDVWTVRLTKAIKRYKRTREKARKRRRARDVRIARAKLRKAIQRSNSACAQPAEY